MNVTTVEAKYAPLSDTLVIAGMVDGHLWTVVHNDACECETIVVSPDGVVHVLDLFLPSQATSETQHAANVANALSLASAEA